MDTIRLLVGLLLVVGLTACSQSFWDRPPRVAGQVQPSPYTTAPAPSARAAPPSAYAPPAPVPTADQERMVLQHVNQIRTSQGLRPLSHSDTLYRAAREHSEEQCKHGYMGHESPDPARRTLVQRMQLAGYQGVIYGEVVAWGYNEPRAVVEGWMNSPPHRAILVDPDMHEAAFARVGQYWTGNFGASHAGPSRRVETSRPPGTTPWRPSAPTTRTPTPQPAPSAAPTVRAPVARPPVQQYFQRVQPPPVQAPTYRPPARGG